MWNLSLHLIWQAGFSSLESKVRIQACTVIEKTNESEISGHFIELAKKILHQTDYTLMMLIEKFKFLLNKK